MKSTGIVRNLDSLNRFVIPVEILRKLGVGDKAPMEVYVDGDRIILKKYDPSCIFCGSMDKVETFKGKLVCGTCRRAMSA